MWKLGPGWALPIVFRVVAFACCVSVQAQVITTLAGTDWIFPSGAQRAVDAPLGYPYGVLAARDGSLYISDRDNHMVFRVAANGVLTTVAGNGLSGSTGDGGPATSASLSYPSGLAQDGLGNLFIADQAAGRVRKVEPNGTITTVAGGGRPGIDGDGGLATAVVFSPNGVAVDSASNLYISDDSMRVRKVTPAGAIVTVAGTGQPGYSGDGGAGTSAALNFPRGLAFDLQGNLLIADLGNNVVRKLTPSGIISTIAGTSKYGDSGDGGAAVNAVLGQPAAIAIDGAGNIFVGSASTVRRISTSGIITTIAGSSFQYDFAGDGGPALGGKLTYISGLTVDGSGAVYLSDTGNFRVRKVATGVISTTAGNGAFRYNGEGGPSTSATLNTPKDVVADSAGNVYFLEQEHPRVRRVAPNGVISTYAGNGFRGFSNDGGLATQASLVDPEGLAIDSAGNLYIADTVSSRIRKVSRTGVITTVAGSLGAATFSGDGGPATSAHLYYPKRVAVDEQGNIFISDTNNDRVRKVSNGIITTIAGNGQTAYSGDGGPARSAALNRPSGIAADASGNVYVSDSGNQRVRRIDPQGNITTVAGNGQRGITVDGSLATSTALADPAGLALDRAGNLYIASLSAILRVSPGGIVSKVAGGGSGGDGGLATQASVSPQGVFVDAGGRTLIADTYNLRVRAVLPAPPSFTVSEDALSFSARAGDPPASAKSISLSSSLTGVPFSLTTSGEPWLSVSPGDGRMPSVIQVSVDPSALAPGAYAATLTITSSLASPSVRTIAVSLSVDSPLSPTLVVRPNELSFALPARTSIAAQTIAVSNGGGGSLDFLAAATTTSGGPWLTVSPASGTALASAGVSLTVSADPNGLAPGIYLGRIAVAAADQSASVAVTLTISAVQQTIVLSQTGLTFSAVAQGGAPPPQSFAILNTGQGAMAWTATPSTLSGGANWLSVTPASGSTDSGSPPSAVTVRVDHTGLAPGDYYGQVRVSAAAADNTPQFVSVVISVLPAGSQPGPLIQPSGLIFTGAAGSSPGSQTLSIANISAAPVSFSSGRLTLSGVTWFAHLPTDATVAPGAPLQIVVQPDLRGLTPGIHRGALTFLFTDGSIRTISLFLVVAPSAAGSDKSPPLAPGCSPTRLVPVFTSLGDNFNFAAAWPATVEARVVDDCGDSVSQGFAVATFSNGDPVLKLTSLGDGRWTGTWQPRLTGQTQVSISLAAETRDPVLRGTAQAIGGLRSNVNTPSIDSGAVVSSASLTRQLPLAPGALVSIFGSRLSDRAALSPLAPWETSLAGTGVLMAGQLLPLASASDGQIDAVLRYDAPVNTRLQIVVFRGVSAAQPETVTLAAAQPSIFTADRTGKGQGLVYAVTAAGGQVLADASAPARAGDTIVIHCSGLGAVDPPFVAGESAPASRIYSIVNPASLSIGGVEAQVVFAGLLPDHVGWYQVRAVVPANAPTGNDVPVVLTVAGQTGPAVTISIE